MSFDEIKEFFSYQIKNNNCITDDYINDLVGILPEDQIGRLKKDLGRIRIFYLMYDDTFGHYSIRKTFVDELDVVVNSLINCTFEGFTELNAPMFKK